MHSPLAFFFSFLTTCFFLFPFFWLWCCTTFVHFYFFSMEKVFSVDKNKTRGKLLNWRRMSASYKYGFCLLLLCSFRCYKFYVPPFFHWKRNQLSMPHKKTTTTTTKTHSHTWSKRALQWYHVNPVFWLTWLDLTADFQHQPRRKLTLSQQTKQTEQIDDLFTKQLLFLKLSKWSLNK